MYRPFASEYARDFLNSGFELEPPLPQRKAEATRVQKLFKKFKNEGAKREIYASRIGENLESLFELKNEAEFQVIWKVNDYHFSNRVNKGIRLFLEKEFGKMDGISLELLIPAPYLFDVYEFEILGNYFRPKIHSFPWNSRYMLSIPSEADFKRWEWNARILEINESEFYERVDRKNEKNACYLMRRILQELYQDFFEQNASPKIFIAVKKLDPFYPIIKKSLNSVEQTKGIEVVDISEIVARKDVVAGDKLIKVKEGKHVNFLLKRLLQSFEKEIFGYEMPKRIFLKRFIQVPRICPEGKRFYCSHVSRDGKTCEALELLEKNECAEGKARLYGLPKIDLPFFQFHLLKQELERKTGYELKPLEIPSFPFKTNYSLDWLERCPIWLTLVEKKYSKRIPFKQFLFVDEVYPENELKRFLFQRIPFKIFGKEGYTTLDLVFEYEDEFTSQRNFLVLDFNEEGYGLKSFLVRKAMLFFKSLALQNLLKELGKDYSFEVAATLYFSHPLKNFFLEIHEFPKKDLSSYLELFNHHFHLLKILNSKNLKDYHCSVPKFSYWYRMYRSKWEKNRTNFHKKECQACIKQLFS